MNQPYRANLPGGIRIEATGEFIYPGDPAWKEYEAWLAVQPGSDTPGGPPPAGTGLLPYVEPVATIEQQKIEAFAQVDGATATHRVVGTMDALGHTWRLDAPFLISVAIHNAAPGLPKGFALPDVNHVMVPLTQGQLNQLLVAMSAYLFTVEQRQAELIADIHASPAPLAVNLETGWPS